MAYSLFQTLNLSKQDMINRLVNLDVVSNNLANVNTAGYRSSRANFQELLSKVNRDGNTMLNTQILTQQGSLATSTSALDWAIEGEGFFQVTLPDGTIGYTRDGRFGFDGEGALVNASGYPLVFEGTLPEGVTEIGLTKDGAIQALTADGEVVDVGQLELARFVNASGLRNYGTNIYVASDSSGEPIVGAPNSENFGVVKTYAYEQSNLNIAEEMTNIMTLQRAFQMSVRAFQQSDTMISQAIHMRKG